jgi:electron transfer flavoprotein alpha subunit
MKNIFVYCETEKGKVADVSLELLTKGHELSNRLACKLEALVIGHQLSGIEQEIYEYGADIVHLADDPRLEPYLTLPHASIVTGIFEEEKPQIALFGATSLGRDLAPRVSSALKSGLTADCTSLEIGDHKDNKGNEYKNLLLQIRPAFGGNIIATIINPDHRPQMATVREGVMRKAKLTETKSGETKIIDVNKYVKDEDFVISIIERHLEERKIDIKNAPIIVSGGYGVGSKENFDLLFEFASVLGGEVGASRAAVDAGYADHARQVGQTGVTVRPKLYIACGISGQVQHTAGMQESAMVIAINNDPNAPINQIADYSIVGDLSIVIPKMIKYYKANSK